MTAKFTQPGAGGKPMHRREQHFKEEYASITPKFQRHVVLRFYETRKVISVCLWLRHNGEERFASAMDVFDPLVSRDFKKKRIVRQAFEAAGILFQDSYDSSPISNYVEAAALLVSDAYSIFVNHAKA